MLTRLNKYLAESGCCSRRKADELISGGKVSVNGKVAVVGKKVDPNTDIITIDGREIRFRDNFIYYALYKPVGVVSTAYDPQGRPTVLDYVPKSPRVYPVGRLDYDSEGLIILTNDGELANRLTHPSFEHKKEYQVDVKIQMPAPSGVEGSSVKNTEQRLKDIKRGFEQGLNIDGKLMKADQVSDFDIQISGFVTFKVTLHTGYNRQIRRMCAKMGLEVRRLVRTRIGKLKLSDLNLGPGKHKSIKREDLL
ncbi:MAG: pseudouridine synthase [Patescibacteria group bacterium]|mgnify:CR=1 FL=1